MASPYLSGASYGLRVRQQPQCARVAIGKEKGTDRKPIDPPPIVQLTLGSRKDPNNNFLQSPYLILTARLVSPNDEASSPEDQSPSPNPKENALTGTVVSSLYSLKDTDNSQGGFFVFGDLSVRKEGHYKLEFTLYELKLENRECWMLCRVLSDKFQVFSQKEFPGLSESTFLTRSFSDQGVRLRLRKDSRSITTRKRNNRVADTIDQVRGVAHYYGNGPQVTSPTERSPNGGHHPHAQFRRSASFHDGSIPAAHMDRTRGAMPPQGGGGYFPDVPQLRGEYGNGSYGYAGYEDRPAKRQRIDTSVGSHHYDSDYAAYSQAGPRTVPEIGGNLYPITSMPSQPSMPGLPMPGNYPPMPRLNTQMSPEQQQHTAPNSAASQYSQHNPYA